MDIVFGRMWTIEGDYGVVYKCFFDKSIKTEEKMLNEDFDQWCEENEDIYEADYDGGDCCVCGNRKIF